MKIACILERWLEFFEDDKKRLSMARLTIFFSFFPATYYVLTAKSDTAFMAYLGAYVLGYVGNRGFSAWEARGVKSARR